MLLVWNERRCYDDVLSTRGQSWNISGVRQDFKVQNRKFELHFAEIGYSSNSLPAAQDDNLRGFAEEEQTGLQHVG